MGRVPQQRTQYLRGPSSAANLKIQNIFPRYISEGFFVRRKSLKSAANVFNIYFYQKYICAGLFPPQMHICLHQICVGLKSAGNGGC